MHPDVKMIQQAIHAVLSPLGFKKNRAVWIRVLPEVRQVVALDRGTWGSRCWFDFGVNVRKVNDDPKPRFYQLHLRWSDSQLMPEKERLAWIDIKDLDDPVMSPEERAEKFADVAHRYILPTLALVDSVKMIKKYLANPPRGNMAPGMSMELRQNLHLL